MNGVDNYNAFEMANYHTFMTSLNHKSFYYMCAHLMNDKNTPTTKLHSETSVTSCWMAVLDQVSMLHWLLLAALGRLMHF